jgi:hypothetical protein
MANTPVDTNFNKYQTMAATYGDLAQVQFATDLKKNPTDYANFTKAQVNTMVDEAWNRKRASFQKAHIDLARYMDMEHNSDFYKARSGDVDRLTDVIGANNRRIQQDLGRDKDMSRRQFEINDWFNYNKLETLFFLQAFFIASLALAIVIFYQKNGTLTTSTASLLMTLIIGIIVLLGVYRWYFTGYTRDGRLWHRRRFPKVKEQSKPGPRCKNGEINIDLETNCGNALEAAGSSSAKYLEAKLDGITSEMNAFQSDGIKPAPFVNCDAK